MILNGAVYASGPQYGGSPPGDRSKNAEADCRDESGNACVGYDAATQTATPRPSTPTASAPPKSTAPAGATAKCLDGTYSFSQHRRGTCSHHGGVAVWLREVPP